LQSTQSMDELINRCLMSVSTHSSLPHSSSAVWQDYRFHNQVSRFLLGFFYITSVACVAIKGMLILLE